MQVHGKTDKCSVKNPRSGSHGKEIQKQHCIREKKRNRERILDSWYHYSTSSDCITSL